MTKKKNRRVAVIDFETDPFLHGRVPEPFCCEFYSDQETVVFWGDDCAEQLIEFLRSKDEPHLIYAHNGGKFDYHFILKYIENPVLVIKTRITKAKLFKHEIRDSFSILPVPLRDYDKMEFDYSKMERHCREKHKAEILEYLHYDCLKLYELVSAFVDRFGAQLTIGGTAMREIQKLHPFNKSGRSHDEYFRKYYHGGAVRVFRSGILPGPWKLFDVNGSYPASMKYKKHPINGMFDFATAMPDTFDMPFFMTFEGVNRGALPTVAEDGSLTFDQREGIFRACSHEIEVALKYDLIEIGKIHECLVSTEAISFDKFVDGCANRKAAAKEAGDKTNYLFEKLLANSGYGRFSINPDNFSDWIVHNDFGNEAELEEQGYTLAADYEVIELWSRPAEISNDDFCDVAVAASITSASRALLLEGLQNAVDPIYCDTDSIICRDFDGDIHASRLGAWDLEKEADIVAIGGKKLYALYSKNAIDQFKNNKKSHTTYACAKCKLAFSDPFKHREHQLACNVKISSKGGSLNLKEIVGIASGDIVRFENDAPTFSLKTKPRFVTRTFSRTSGEDVDLVD